MSLTQDANPVMLQLFLTLIFQAILRAKFITNCLKCI